MSDYTTLNDGLVSRVIRGMVDIVEAKDAIGLTVSRTESNWFAIVSGDHDSVYIPGCQVKSIERIDDPNRAGSRDVYRVP